MAGGSPCASCKLLRRRCAKDCTFAPYFPSDDPQKFAIVHKVFGASNINKMLQELPFDKRSDAVSSLVFEANARMRDPVYGCVGAISYLQNQVSQLQMQLAVAQAEILCIQMQQSPNHHHHHPSSTPTNYNSFLPTGGQMMTMDHYPSDIGYQTSSSEVILLGSSTTSTSTTSSGSGNGSYQLPHYYIAASTGFVNSSANNSNNNNGIQDPMKRESLWT